MGMYFKCGNGKRDTQIWSGRCREERGRLHRAVSDSGFGFGAKNLCSKLPAAGIRTRIRIRIREAPMMRAAAST